MSRWTTPQAIPNDVNSAGPQVLAAGLWRCATSSLQIAFEELLDPPLRPSMHGTYLFTSMHKIKLSVAALKEPDRTKRQAILRQIFTGYNASSDFPGMGFVDDLLEMYPDMKVVLNKRGSAGAWERSVNGSLRYFSTWRYGVVTCLSEQSRWHWLIYRQYTALAKRRFGENTDIWDRKYYDSHNEWVRQLCRKHGKDWLEWEPDMGWEPLCKFLERKVPTAEFPKLNESAEIKKGIWMLTIRGLVYWACTIAAVVLAVWLYRR